MPDYFHSQYTNRNILHFLISITLLPLVLGALSTNAAAQLSPNNGLLNVHFLDVGQGDANVIITPDERVILIDSGPPGSTEDLIALLHQLGIQQINLALISHAHADHIGGFKEIAEAFEILRFGDPGYPHASGLYSDLLESLIESEIPIWRLTSGQRIQIEDDIEMRVLSPEEGFIDYANSPANANSLVVQLSYGEVDILFTGDAESETEMQMLSNGWLTDIEVLKVGHHGSHTSSTPLFLERTSPEIAIISCGMNNSYGHPDVDITSRLRSIATDGIYVTSEHGSITVVTDGTNIEVFTQPVTRQ
jgi:competence protein ComEC